MSAGESFPSLIDDARLRPLTTAERARYSRNVLVPEVGGRGQQRIRAARVLVVGAGGLGSPAVLYLAAAGVGTLGIIDDDDVAISNLQRQVLHTTAAAGRPKVDSARDAVTALNPDVEVVAHRLALTSANALELLRGWDVVVDATDNFPTRYLLSDTCVLLGIPLVHGAVLGLDGQVTIFDAARGPCYRCVHPIPPAPGAVPSCAEVGVLGVLPGIVGAMQAAEALKLVVGGARPLIGRMLVLDAWDGRGAELPIGKRPDCPACGPNSRDR
ncbi:adenylyltransferase and sulfurtransferase [Actinomyces ruminicola]|uniref:Adenylyltransferase and sulfurtransferase n=1 Tax=Actinomyces ruminicola TaxID=332524 RepID=A0A1H0CU68_9ACTO|nr:adenylyltransferase and sulfurtransferase [Actinomyces ruminicola]